MGFRRKVKDKLKSILGRTANTDSFDSSPSPEEDSVSITPSAPPVADKVVAQSTVATVKQPVATSPPSANATSNSVDEAKVAKHLKRTKRGLLKFVDKEGGTISLAKLHDHSEKRFFVGHRKFSDLMETMIEEDYLLFSWEKQEATLTERGREWALQK